MVLLQCAANNPSGSPVYPHSGGERGSLVFAALLFLVFFFLLAGLAVDLSRYYLHEQNLQNVADGAATAGAQALSQYRFKDDIDEDKVYREVLAYIRANQGREYTDLYTRKENGGREGIHVARFGPNAPSQRCVDFSLKDGAVQLNQPADVEAEVLGTALSFESNGQNGIQEDERWPVTARVEVTREDGSETSSEPWGAYDDPRVDGGNMNTGQTPSPAQLNDVPPEWEIDIRARSWGPQAQRGGPPAPPYDNLNPMEDHLSSGQPPPTMEVRTGDEEAFTFKDGDQAPSFDGIQNQPNAADFIKPYVANDGTIQLQGNQAIVFFELYTRNEDEDAYDQQDLAVLLTLTPTGGSGGGGVRTGSPPWITPDGAPCGNSEPHFRIGVQSYENFQPMFLPESVFGTHNKPIIKQAVAEVRPRFVHHYGRAVLDCTVYGGSDVILSADDARIGGGACVSEDLIVDGQDNGSHINKLVKPKGARHDRPSFGAIEQVKTFDAPPGQRPVSSLKPSRSDPGNFEVDMTMGTYSSTWGPTADCPSARGAGGPVKRKAMQSPGGIVQWVGQGRDVCVTQETGGHLKISWDGGNVGQIGTSSRPVTIYTNKRIRVGGRIELHGALVSSKDITVNGAGHTFVGEDRQTLGGLTLWSEQDLQILAPASRFEGIVGADGNVTFGQENSAAPGLEGLLIAGGTLELNGTGRMSIIPGPKTYDAERVLNSPGWTQRRSRPLGDKLPPFSEAQITLID